MKIIPNIIYSKKTPYSERRVFSKLEESFKNDNKYIAFHSFNLKDHKSKRFGEIDFVIICKYGLYVLEVKGNTIKVENGIWYQKKNDNTGYKRLNEPPNKQAESGLFAIEKVINNSCKINTEIKIGTGVIFPDVEWTINSGEFDEQIICDCKKFKNFERWLGGLFNYWKDKGVNKNRPMLNEQEIHTISKLLRPDFELVEPLHAQLDKIEENVVKLTEEQYKYLDIAKENTRVLCYGGAGTGKTFLAKELGRRISSKDKKVVLVCKSKWLKNYLEPRAKNEFLTLSTIDSLRVDMKRARVEKYDAIIVDEGQDIFNFEDISKLDEVLEGGLENGEWYIFHDVNNQSGLFGSTQKEVVELLESYHPAKIPLNVNCRNTENILKQIQLSLKLDVGTRGIADGPKVVEFNAKEKRDAIEKTTKIIEDILKNGINPGDITLLSPVDYEKSIISKLPNDIINRIVLLDNQLVRNFPLNKISFSEIKNFKGLENKIIILTDLVNPTTLQSPCEKVNHYVGMSRARDLLYTIWI